jgi:hypothetical protein
MLCKHKYIVLDKTILPSLIEQLGKGTLNIERMTPDMYQKCLVLTLQCEKCGYLKIDKTYNPCQY